MSVYKEETRFLREAIESILTQTYKDFEFIIVGDSPISDRERVFNVVEEYAAKDSRIKFLPNEKNIGLTKSLNLGLSHCSGKYIARMDADDVSMPFRLEKQVAFMEANPTILVSSAWVDIINQNGDKIGHTSKNNSDPQQIRLLMFYHNCIAHPASIFHRVINGNPVLYDETIKYAQDYSLWTEFLKNGELSNIQEVLLHYRKTPEQISTSKLSEQQECAKIAQKKMFLLYNFPMMESFLDIFYQMTIRNNHDIPFKIAKSEFQSFIGNTRITTKNEKILQNLVWFYLKYYSNHLRRQVASPLFSITKNKPIFMVKMEAKYIMMRVVQKLRTITA